MSLFPRPRAQQPHAWGLLHNVPTQNWERFSPAYEAQAETIWNAFRALGLASALEWAGSEDGEAINGRDPSARPGEVADIAVLFHLENPQEAQRLQTAIAAGGLAALIADDIRANEATAKRFRCKDAARRRPPPPALDEPRRVSDRPALQSVGQVGAGQVGRSRGPPRTPLTFPARIGHLRGTAPPRIRA